ncbi:PadR family transcriptional regulator [Halobacterium hubeiense]|uniref:PadR family transcriptional regulator n=1 Tax=Halobacterium hubeiense TaxID=1407499 RepID=UPI00073F29A7|nr:PadR family transcriptional regulator [Halobacterium hubeiense]
MFDIIGFQRDLLFVIAGLDTPHGTTISDELDEAHGPDINPGQLYPNLDKLADEGYQLLQIRFLYSACGAIFSCRFSRHT